MADDDTPLQALYPFLHERAPDPDEVDTLLCQSVRHKAERSVAVKQAFFDTQGAALVAAARGLAAVYAAGGRLFCAGNGGSSCDAAHIAVEFLHPVTAGRPALSAINLANDMAMLTAVANDVGFEQVFVRQLVAQARPGDALIAVSTSGNSQNLLGVLRTARELGLLTIGLGGGDGGAMAAAGLDHSLTVESDSIHRIQETHVAAYHILWDLVHTLLADRRGPPPQPRS